MSENMTVEIMIEFIMQILSGTKISSDDGVFNGDDTFSLIEFYEEYFSQYDQNIYYQALRALMDQGWLEEEVTPDGLCIITQEGIANL